MKTSFFLLLSFVPTLLFASEDFDTTQTIQRIQPVGRVKIQEEQNVQTITQSETLPTVQPKKEPGEGTYEQYCIICHRDGVAGAPKFRNKDDWKTRIQGKNVDDLLAIAKSGLNAMPPKGTCSDCSDEDLKDAIQYMLPR